MTPKQKAEELVDRCYQLFPLEQNVITTHGDLTVEYSGWNNAKKCALIAVDELILSAPFEPAETDWDDAGSSAQYWYPQKLEDSAKWWSEVKKEIEKL